MSQVQFSKYFRFTFFIFLLPWFFVFVVTYFARSCFIFCEVTYFARRFLFGKDICHMHIYPLNTLQQNIGIWEQSWLAFLLLWGFAVILFATLDDQHLFLKPVSFYVFWRQVALIFPTFDNINSCEICSLREPEI